LNGEVVEVKNLNKDSELKQIAWLGKNSSEIVIFFGVLIELYQKELLDFGF